MSRFSPQKIYFYIQSKAHYISRKIFFKKAKKRHFKLAESSGITVKVLSKEQKQEIKNIWGKWGKDYSTHQLIYSITGKFNPLICPESAFGTVFEFDLNNQNYTFAWSDKNYFNKFFPEVKFPHSLVHNISGTFYDDNYKILDESQVLTILLAHEYICVKPSLDSGSGIGVRKIKVDEKIKSILDEYKQDFVIQEIMEQYEPIKKLNPSSVNVLRTITLFLNGKPQLVTSTLRCGAIGAFNDNSISKDGKGMFVIGVTPDGILKDTGYYSCGLSLSVAPNGQPFAGIQLPNYARVKALVENIHSQMPFFGFVGFDVAFGVDGEPVIMEYNVKAPGVFYYQLANGPLFGDYTEDIIKASIDKRFKW